MNNRLLERITLELYDTYGDQDARIRLGKYYLEDIISASDYIDAITFLNKLLGVRQVRMTVQELRYIKQDMLVMIEKYRYFGQTTQVNEREQIIEKIDYIIKIGEENEDK